MTNSRIRILFTIPNFDTAGSGKALLNIAKGLDSKLFEPHIMCIHNRGEFFQVVEQSGIPLHIYPYTTEIKPYWKGLLECWKVSRKFKHIAPDIIHSFHYSADYSEALAAKLAGIKWIYSKKNMNWGGGARNAWKLRTCMASRIVAQNTDMLTEFFPNLKKVRLIPRGVDTNQFYPRFKGESIVQKWEMSMGKRWIICVANLSPIKGVDKLILAFSELAASFPEWNLLLVGDDKTEYAKQLKESIGDLQNRIFFSGKVIDVRPYLSIADVFVLPTANKGEGSPLAILEAMASGLIVLGSNVPGIRDQLNSFPELLFNPDDFKHLKSKLEKIISLSEVTARYLRESLLVEINEKFNLSIEIDRHEKLYTSISY